MKKLILLTVVATFACCLVSKANVIGGGWNTGDPTALYCSSWPFSMNLSTATFGMTGTQYGSPATMTGWVDTDTVLDPTLFLGSGVDNDTAGAWIGYQVNVYVNNPTFTFVGTPTVSTIPGGSWFLASGPTTPTLVVGGFYNGYYEGTFDFSDGGTPLLVGDELDFNYAIHFASSTDYAFTQEMIPMFQEVPEPGTLALAGMGGLMLALRLRRNRRQGA